MSPFQSGGLFPRQSALPQPHAPWTVHQPRRTVGARWTDS